MSYFINTKKSERTQLNGQKLPSWACFQCVSEVLLCFHCFLIPRIFFISFLISSLTHFSFCNDCLNCQSLCIYQRFICCQFCFISLRSDRIQGVISVFLCLKRFALCYMMSLILKSSLVLLNKMCMSWVCMEYSILLGPFAV